MKRIIRIAIWAISIISILLFLGIFEIRCISNPFLITLWSNFNSISTIIYALLPLGVLTTLILLFHTNKWALRVEKMTIGGFCIIFDNPVKLYKRQVKKYLDTKRTIFKIDHINDNFNDTLDSYFEIYIFFREEVKVLGNVKMKGAKFPNKEEAANIYVLTNQAIQILNDFLTKNQSNYRRWYKYIEKFDEKAYYLTPIGTLQKKYPHYESICRGFEEVNKFFVDIMACEFNVDVAKWGVG